MDSHRRYGPRGVRPSFELPPSRSSNSRTTVLAQCYSEQIFRVHPRAVAEDTHSIGLYQSRVLPGRSVRCCAAYVGWSSPAGLLHPTYDTTPSSTLGRRAVAITQSEWQTHCKRQPTDPCSLVRLRIDLRILLLRCLKNRAQTKLLLLLITEAITSR
jgi:hypothetical protein